MFVKMGEKLHIAKGVGAEKAQNNKIVKENIKKKVNHIN
jgi:hypothetical protein